MNKRIKTILAFSFAVSTVFEVFSQNQPPIGTGLSNSAPVATKANNAWYRDGNILGGPGGTGNVFGFRVGNSPIYTYTDAQIRHKVNGSYNPINQYGINGYIGGAGVTNINTSGYLLLGHSAGFSNTLFTTQGAFSLLHLNGRDGTFVQDGGYRPWMKTGITFTDNNDLSYIGIRKVGAGTDVTETVIAWSDNFGTAFPGPDDMAFRFLSGGNGNTTISNNLLVDNDLDGLHIARFTPEGLFGLGNTFGSGGGNYVRPQSLAHLSYSNSRSVWMQFTNRANALGTGTGETQFDGLRVGIFGSGNALQNGIAMAYNQENRPLLFSVNANTNTANAVNTSERVRIMAYNTPTALAGGGYGVFSPIAPAPANQNITRMSVSHNPAQPVTRPLSLLHLGYNTGLVSLTPGATDGWRNWMDIGTFTTNGTDNMYVGLKNEQGPLGDRFDAIISWGDNQVSALPPGNGPDFLRFIFTSTLAPTGGGAPPATSNDGLEVARMHPGIASTLTNNYGMLGVGDFTAGGPNAALPIDAKVDIDGDLRIRTVTQDDNLTQVLVIDPADLNRVHWRDISTVTSPAAGNFCSNAPNLNPLTDDFTIPLDDFNYYFEGQSSQGKDRVGIGYDCSTGVLPGKLSVLQDDPATTDVLTKAAYIENNNNFFSLAGITDDQIGVFGISQGVFFTTQIGRGNIGGQFIARNSLNSNTGVEAIADSPGSFFNYGIRAFGTHFGIRASVDNTDGIYAGLFEGDIFVNGPMSGTGVVLATSDRNLKTAIDSIKNATELIRRLEPKTFYFDTLNNHHLRLPSNRQYGLIAQEVESILPELVTEVNKPAELDSAGNIAIPEFTFKSLNYNAFIGILLQAVKEQQQKIDALDPLNSATNDSLLSVLQEKIDEKDAAINALNDRLTQLENCLSNILPLLCQINNSAIQQTNEQTQNEMRSMMDVLLENKETIVLEQNAPNPFAEQTVIDFTVPASVQHAQILFYNQEGKLIRSVEITDRGQGRMNVFGSDLSSGIYTYSLIADGQVIATKKMVKLK